MEGINNKRVFKRNDEKPNGEGDYVLYWMQINRRFQYNFALEYAVKLANHLNKPLLIYEGLSCDYPWAADRFHYFLMEGMAENRAYAQRNDLNYYSYLEDEPGAGDGLLYALANDACAVVSDEYPVFIIREHNEKVGPKLDIPYTTVDSNGLIPLGITEKAPYNAYFFRKIMQRNFLSCYKNGPKKNPLKELENRSTVTLPSKFLNKYPRANSHLDEPDSFISSLDINHEVDKIELDGSREAALTRLDQFIQNGLKEYDDKRNDPDEEKTSRLSPWLHFGKISEYEIVDAVLKHQPKGWDLEDITFNKGSTGGFFNGDPNVDGFLDEVITWREVGFHFAHHEPDYDTYDSLPDWALKTLEKHKNDPREYIYELEEFAQSQTHDEIWNAAQTQLREEGIIHNYLRMLWGKKVLEWTPNPETALAYLIELNNRYAIDGRDPNSYSGIFWIFGRFDRAWQERPIYGKTRYMTSDSTRKKVKLDEYLQKYGSRGSQQALEL
ncbi:FAD-binding domain-containing protein [Fodinibius saliphilus]|uniref:FAD-binding domain-containing protein n=1 Tax=Fodinibius saliphilus TaxID=1920650 RepID=UPI0011098E31|nr:FAD-binding domain-containing protein [Fodinibius saliphilus]